MQSVGPRSIADFVPELAIGVQHLSKNISKRLEERRQETEDRRQEKEMFVGVSFPTQLRTTGRKGSVGDDSPKATRGSPED